MSFLIFDIETRVDKALVRSTQYRAEEVSEQQAYERMRTELLDQSEGRSEFFPLSYHVPISIALGTAGTDHVLQHVEVLKADEVGEADVVRMFWERLEAFDDTVVSFNGRNFDLPVLELQALRHGCVAPRYFNERNGVRARFGRHYDLYDFFTNGGAVRVRGGFDLLAQLAGLPGKGDIAGGDVQALWESGQWDAIHRYCARDVIQTYFLFLRVECLRGRLSRQRLCEVEAATRAFRAQLGAAPG